MSEETLKGLLDAAEKIVSVGYVWARTRSASPYISAAIAIGQLYLALPEPYKKIANAAGLQTFVNVNLGVPLGFMEAERIIDAIKNSHHDEIPPEVRRAFQEMA